MHTHNMHIQIHGTYYCPLWRTALRMASLENSFKVALRLLVSLSLQWLCSKKEQGHGHNAAIFVKMLYSQTPRSDSKHFSERKFDRDLIWQDFGACLEIALLPPQVPAWYLTSPSRSGALAEISVICNDIWATPQDNASSGALFKIPARRWASAA